MSVIDTLVIELGLDGSKFSKGAKQSIKDLRAMEKQAEKTGKDVADSGDKAAEFFSKVRREALGMFAVFTAGRSIKTFVGDITQSNAQLGYLSARLGIAPRRLYQLEQAAKAAGGSVGEVGSAFDALQQKLTNAQERAAVNRTFQQLGLSTNEWMDGKTGGVVDNIAERLNKSIRTNHLSAPLATALMRQLGFGEGMINEALMDPARLAQIQKSFQGVGPTEQQIRDSEKLLADWTALTAQTEKLGRSILGDLTPGLDKLVVDLTEWEKANPDLAKGIAEITLGVGALGTAVTALMALGAVRQLFAFPAAIRAATMAAGAGGGAAGAAAETAGASFLGGWLPEAALAWLALRPEHANVGESALVQKLYASGRMGGTSQRKFSAKEISSREGRALAILMGQGYSREAALGIIGNLRQESGLDETARGDAGNAFGLAQWHADRAEQIKRKFGIDVRTADFDSQIMAIIDEMRAGDDKGARQAGAALSGPVSMQGASTAFKSLYERPADRLGNENMLRFALARQAANDLGATSGGMTVNIGDINITTPSTDPQRHGEMIASVLRRHLPMQNANGQQ